MAPRRRWLFGHFSPRVSRDWDGSVLNERPQTQRTIASPVTVSGFGYWSGQDVSVEFRPAVANHGIVFVRSDLSPQTRVPALVKYRIDAQRRTVLERFGVRVAMVEHILAALAGLGVDNCEVHVSAEETPGLEGSSRAFVEAIEQAEIVEMDVPRRSLEIRETIRLEDGPAWIEARPCSSRTGTSPKNWAEQSSFSIEYHLDYGEGNPIGRQSIDLEVTPDSFRSELAPARTFMFKHEAQWLVSQGLGTRVTSRDLLVFDEEGPIENSLRFDDECVRHKVLDVVGDLALAGCDLLGRIVAYRSGHRLNAELVRAIQEQAARNQTQFEEPPGSALSA